MDNFGETITWIFVTVNSVRVLAYGPQILAAWRCADGARSISLLTWAYFAVAHLSGALYSLAVAGDARLATAFAGNCVACSALVVVVAWKRRQRAAMPDLPGNCAIDRLTPAANT
jgi:tryptophan-rich sensory protein